MRAHSPAGTRPPWRSRPSWFFSVQMIASMRCRSQFGKYRGGSSLRAGRISARSRPGLAKNSSVPSPARPLSVTMAVPGRWAVGGLAAEHLPGLVAFASQFRVGQAEPGHRPLAGADQHQLGSPVPARMAGAVAVSRPSRYRPERRAVTADWPHGTGVASSSRSSSALAGVRPASHRSAASISGPAARSRWLYSLWRQQPGNRCPTRQGSRAQPVPLVVIAQQHLRHRQADQLGVGHLRPLARPGPGKAQRGDDAVGQFHIRVRSGECPGRRSR